MPAISPAVLNICRRDDDEENVEEGIRVGGELIKDVKYAGMVASTEAGLQSLMDGLNTTAKHYDMKINIKDKGYGGSREMGRESEHNSRRSTR